MIKPPAPPTTRQKPKGRPKGGGRKEPPKPLKTPTPTRKAVPDVRPGARNMIERWVTTTPEVP